MYSYCREIRERGKDPESFATWTPSTADEVFKTLCDRPSLSSVNSVFSTNNSADNLGYQQDAGSLKVNGSTTSVTSEASEVFEEVNKQEKPTEITPANYVVSVTVHTSTSEHATTEVDKNSTKVSVNSTGSPSRRTKTSVTAIEIGEEPVFETIDESEETRNGQVGDLNSPENLVTASTGVTKARQRDAETNIEVARVVMEDREDNIACQNETSSMNERPQAMLSNNEAVDGTLHEKETNNEQNKENRE